MSLYHETISIFSYYQFVTYKTFLVHIMTPNLNNEAMPRKPAVFYNGACPLCRCETQFYQGVDCSKKIEW